ncbi:uncharacterized protein LOC112569119 isoform X2 [Pomacea canaliculata]|uniref:uncharacterized protein LOC112569119 isoform X2 n=1 Tax=Pomacea canaliculata TaxID=400727 RepID=UPI000D73423E|nr:uncharacterized protein LOC112569119 isoform X2 [Pomacea canaliculata]
MAVWSLWILCGVALVAVKDCSGLVIGGCEQGSVDVVEDSDRFFTCDGNQNRELQWAVYNDKSIFIALCLQWSCLPWSNIFTFSVEHNYGDEYYRYNLTMKTITRNSARTLSCRDSSKYAQCDLRIIVKPVYSDCNVTTLNWMVIGSCTVRGMYSSDNIYTCKWRENENNDELSGFKNSLTTYTEGSRTYTEGVCSFAKPIPQTKGIYTYSISVSPGADDHVVTSMLIDALHWIQLSHNCPEYVFEGLNVSCTCSASRAISPPAFLVWGGMSNATLLLKNVSRRLNQQEFKCRLKWSTTGSTIETTSYQLTVAYGPADVLITNNKNKTEDEMISLTCTATDVYPSAVFQWNVTCSNRTDSGNSSTCSFTFNPKFESLAILCTASNAYYHQVNSSYVYVLPTSGSPQANTSGPNAGLIGGVIAAVLVVLIIVAVLIVYIIKRRKDPLYDTARRPENNEHSYVDLALSGRKSSPGADDDKAKRENNSGHRYEEVTIAGQNVSEQPDVFFVLPTRTTVASL